MSTATTPAFPETDMTAAMRALEARYGTPWSAPLPSS